MVHRIFRPPSTTRARPHGGSHGIALLVALGGLLALRLLALRFNRTDLFFDEAQYWAWSRELSAGYYSKPPLIAWIIRTATAICGDGEACVRSASPVLHTLTAGWIFLCGRRLYDSSVGLWSAVAFATLPGVSLSANLISTDVALLTCWAAALHAFVCLIDDPDQRWAPSLALGAALGLGLNAKYAMIFFVICAGSFLAATAAHRHLLGDRRIWGALAIASLLIAPNLVWNARHGFATFGHTADNARWRGALLHPVRMAEFFVAQFAVFGLLFFAVLLWFAWQIWHKHRLGQEPFPEHERLLLWMSLPVLVAITLQALLARAHANWAAVAYVGAVIVVVAHLLRTTEGGCWLRATIGLHVAVALFLAAGLATAGHWRVPPGADPLERLQGWRALGRAVSDDVHAAVRARRPYAAVLTDERQLTAALVYYMRGETIPIVAWRPPGIRQRDHFELTRPYTSGIGEPVLMISLQPSIDHLLPHFALITRLEPVVIPAGRGTSRTLHRFVLSGDKGATLGLVPAAH